MITIWDRTLVLRAGRRTQPDRVEINATTLGAAIREAERIFGLPIRPATLNDKYFIVGHEVDPPVDSGTDLHVTGGWVDSLFIRFFPPRPIPRPQPGFGNADIHVERGRTTFCPKHDLAFALLPGDVVVFDQLLG